MLFSWHALGITMLARTIDLVHNLDKLDYSYTMCQIECVWNAENHLGAAQFSHIR